MIDRSPRNFSIPTDVSPTAHRRRRREAAGRSGGVFERVPGSASRFDFQYINKPLPTIDESPSRMQRWYVQAVTESDSGDEREMSLSRVGRWIDTSASIAVNPAESDSARAMGYQARQDGKQGIESATTSRSAEPMIPISQPKRRVRKVSLSKIGVRLKNRVASRRVETFKEHWDGRKRAGSFDVSNQGENEAQTIISPNHGIRARATRFFEHLDDDSDERVDMEEEKVSRHFFGFGFGRKKN